MTETDRVDATQVRPGRLGGPLLVVGGGLAAAFGAASCCGLPLLLGSLGIGSGWLVTVAWLAAPHRMALLLAAVVLMRVVPEHFSGGAGLSRTGRDSTIKIAAQVLLVAMLVIGGALAALNYLYTVGFRP